MKPHTSVATWRAFVHLPVFKLLFASVSHAFPLVSEKGGWAIPTSYRVVDEEGGEAWLYLVIAAILVLLGGAFAGLTIALMGQDEIYLQVLAASGEGAERADAQKVLNLLKRGKHWVLVTLLLGNVITNETLPIMLDRSLGGGWQAVLGSTVLIVIFGEITPQSICVRFGLPIGAFMAPFVLVMMWVMAPVAWPTAKLLDYLLGEDHGTTYKKAGLKTLVTLHRTIGTSPDERLSKDEVTIISAVLDLKAKPVGSIMTPMEDVFTLSAETVLDEEMMNTILSEGYSRIPIYAVDDPGNFIGMLLVKMLITYDPEDCSRVDDFQLATLPETRPETSCLDIVNFFQEGKSHMVLVSEFPGETNGALGVCTLEDVIEELIGEEIIDESDVFVDVHRAIRRLQPVSYYRVPKASKNDAQDAVFEAGPGPIAKYATVPNDTERDRSETGERKLSSVSDHAAKGKAPTAKLRRRRSDGGVEPLSVSRTNPDVKAHLSHLGPSNLASRPKTTRINTVKIKPVHPSATKAQHRGGGISPKSPLSKSESRFSGLVEGLALETAATDRARDIPIAAIETTGLLSAGKPSSDGVQAVGYGTLATSPTTRSRTEPILEEPDNFRSSSIVSSGTQPSPLLQSVRILEEPIDPLQKIPKVPTIFEEQSDTTEPPAAGNNKTIDKGKLPSTVSEPSSTHTRRPSLAPVKLVVTPEDTAGAISEVESDIPDEADSGSTIKSAGTGNSETGRNAARSGSIFQRDFDLNGVRKVVLDVQELPEDISEDEGENHEDPSQPLLSQSLGGEASTAPAAGQVVTKKKKKKKPKKKKKGTD